ncbi:MAG: cupin [Acidobacteria bacterium]|nr:MAG: cupin [Acidobacteriota bacterium]
MPIHIPAPTRIRAAGNKPKRIDEYFGRVNSATERVSVAHMQFEEYTVVLAGMLRVEHRGGRIDVRAGEAVLARAGEWVRYSSPSPGGAEYVAICIPAFSPETAHREPE